METNSLDNEVGETVQIINIKDGPLAVFQGEIVDRSNYLFKLIKDLKKKSPIIGNEYVDSKLKRLNKDYDFVENESARINKGEDHFEALLYMILNKKIQIQLYKSYGVDLK